MITIEQILSTAHADDNDEQPLTFGQLRNAIEDIAADLVDDEVPVLVRIRSADGTTHIGILDALTHCDAGGIIVEANAIQRQ